MSAATKDTKGKNHLSNNGVEYTIRCLLDRAGVPEEQYTVSGPSAHIQNLDIQFHLDPWEEQERLFRGEGQVYYVDSFDGQIQVPLFGAEQFAGGENQCLEVVPDILTISFALLSRYEETLTDRRDQYGRFSYQDSLSAKYDLIGMPLVDEYAMLLCRELVRLGLEGILIGRTPNMIPTHDVDELWRFQSWTKAVKSIVGGDLLIRKSPRTALRSCREVVVSRCKPERDPRYLDCIRLMELSQENGMHSTFFFLDYENGSDWRYDVTHPSVGKLMDHLRDGGSTIGIHGGLGSSGDNAIFHTQKQCVDGVNGEAVTVGRQHFLCFDAMTTPKIWAENGLKEDQTLSFFDHEGFRCGTCRPYPLYDLKADHPLPVQERPLILMDGTVQHYRGLSIEEALASAHAIWRRVLAVGGDFVILWHNSSLDRGMEDWYEKFYIPFIRDGGKDLKRRETEEIS